MENKTTGYYIHGFMNELGLNHKEMLVYAFIYSFTVNGTGFYFGTQKYMADKLSLSMRTLQRILHNLHSKKLIEKYTDGNHRGVRCRPVPKEIQEEKTMDKRIYDFCDEYDGRYATRGGKVIEWSSDMVEKMNRNATEFYKSVTPKHTLIRYGREGLVQLTKPQYDALCSLLQREEVQNYFVRYESMLKENMEKGIPSPHSAYKTIAKWIEDDMSV